MLVCRRNLARPKSTERVEKRHSRIRDDHLPAGDDAAEVNERLGAATTAAGAERGAAAHLVERGRPQDGGGADTVANVWVRGSERWLTLYYPRQLEQEAQQRRSVGALVGLRPAQSGSCRRLAGGCTAASSAVMPRMAWRVTKCRTPSLSRSPGSTNASRRPAIGAGSEGAAHRRGRGVAGRRASRRGRLRRRSRLRRVPTVL